MPWGRAILFAGALAIIGVSPMYAAPLMIFRAAALPGDLPSGVIPLPYGGTFTGTDLNMTLVGVGSRSTGLVIYDTASHLLWLDDGISPLALDTLLGFLGPAVLIYMPSTGVFTPLSASGGNLGESLAQPGSFAVVDSLFGLFTSPRSSLNDPDNDGVPTGEDGCPMDGHKATPGICGCGVPDDDRDQDGWVGCADCDDTDPNRSPSAPEVCNGVDDNCDGQIDATDPSMSSCADDDPYTDDRCDGANGCVHVEASGSSTTTTTVSTTWTTATSSTVTTTSSTSSSLHSTTTSTRTPTTTLVSSRSCMADSDCDDDDPCTEDHCALANSCTNSAVIGFEAVQCVCRRAVPLVCIDQKIPPAVSRQHAYACRFIADAATTETPRTIILVQQARRAFHRAWRFVGTRRVQHDLTAACIVALRGELGDGELRATQWLQSAPAIDGNSIAKPSTK